MSKSLKKSKGLEWKPDTWKSFDASQQPIWPDNNSLQKVLDELLWPWSEESASLAEFLLLAKVFAEEQKFV